MLIKILIETVGFILIWSAVYLGRDEKSKIKIHSRDF